MNLFLDIETTGKVDKYLNWEKDFMKFPHIVSIAWKFGAVEKYFIVHQEGRKIPAEAIAVHGITNKIANDPEKTEPLSFVLGQLMVDAHKAANIIGHNIYFDVSIIKASTLRLFGVKSKEATIICDVLHKDKRIDTMRASQKYFKKWPKLTELHEYLFKKSFEAHSAFEDTRACEKCYNELIKKKMI